MKENTVEKLLDNYDPELAKEARNKIAEYKGKKDISSVAMTDVARCIFLMYGLDPEDITASYSGNSSKAIFSNGKVRICISERKNEKLQNHEKAYGNAFLHEMLHALGYKWKKMHRIENHGLNHSNSEEWMYFKKCLKMLVNAINN